jgi:hypothetical protein
MFNRPNIFSVLFDYLRGHYSLWTHTMRILTTTRRSHVLCLHEPDRRPRRHHRHLQIGRYHNRQVKFMHFLRVPKYRPLHYGCVEHPYSCSLPLTNHLCLLSNHSCAPYRISMSTLSNVYTHLAMRMTKMNE